MDLFCHLMTTMCRLLMIVEMHNERILVWTKSVVTYYELCNGLKDCMRNHKIIIMIQNRFN